MPTALERAGDFSPLRLVPEDKIVVLGLVTTKSPVLENQETLVRRIHEAAACMPIERLAISTQCGFASVAKGNNLTARHQEQKLQRVADVARHIWHD